MIAPPALPSIETIPDDIDDQLRHLIHYAPERVTAEWLLDLIKNSGHLTTPEYMRWRVVSLVWLATKFDTDQAWPYLMWLNMNEPVIGDHLNDLLTDGVEELQCHVQLANWIAEAKDERLQIFFSGYKNIPAPHKMGSVLRRLLTSGRDPAVGVWLAELCADTADNPSPHMRPWRLMIAAWYATCFNPAEGLASLRQLSDGQATLSVEDNRLLMETAAALKATPSLIQWIADCPDPAVQTMLQEFGHPDLDGLVAAIFDNPPDYEHLTGLSDRAAADAATFYLMRDLLMAASVPPTADILDLGCGPLAPHTLLLNSAGYSVVGVDLDIPPRFLPSPGLFQRLFKKGKYVQVWENATADYYRALAGVVADLSLTWKKATVELADLTRLHFVEKRFDVVMCVDHLHQAPDVNGLLAEAARVLKPGGLFLTNIKPFSSFSGGFTTAAEPWGHLRDGSAEKGPVLNRWREYQFHEALEKRFRLEQWRTVQDEAAEAKLTPILQAEFAEYSPEELTRQQIVVVARKA